MTTDATQAVSFRGQIDAAPLKRVVSLVGALVDECHLRVTNDGLQVRAMDPATVAAVDAELGTDAFETFTATDHTLGLDVARLDEVVSMAGDELVTLALDTERRLLTVATETFSYELGLIDPDSIRSPPSAVDEVDAELATLTAPTATLERIVTAGDLLASYVTLAVDTEEPAFVATVDGDTDSFELRRPPAALDSFTPASAESMLSVEYLRAIVAAIPSGTDLEIELGAEQPVFVSFSFAGGDGYGRYTIAPRMARS